MVCKCQPYQLVTLLELLRIAANKFVQIGVFIDTANMSLARIDIWKDAQERQALCSLLEELGTTCIDCDLSVTRSLVDKVIWALKDDKQTCSTGLLSQYLIELRNRFIDELSTKFFFQVGASRKTYFDAPTSGWEKVIERFPQAVGDVEEMNKCFALSRYAGAVFHSLLVVESGLIDLGKVMGVIDPKPGWDATSKKLSQLVNDGHGKYPSTMLIAFGVCEQINQSVQTMKHAWRNRVNHAAGRLVIMQSDFVPDIAEEIIVATRGFMRRLATDLPTLSV